MDVQELVSAVSNMNEDDSDFQVGQGSLVEQFGSFKIIYCIRFTKQNANESKSEHCWRIIIKWFY